MYKLKLCGATAHEGQGLLCPYQYTRPLGAEVHEQIPRSGGQSEARPPVFKSPSKLGTHLSIHCSRDERLNRPEWNPDLCCQVIYSQFGLAIHQNDHQARRRFVEWAQNEIAVVPDFHKRILFSDEAHFWLNGYVNKQNCRSWSEANPQVYVETPLHPEN
ncbi:uncharacterized protein TNCV_1842411 [Trichonephila clavipes]|nr:uncharacterized protein TNCV_1842411 [Trichonephila clavipes]